MLLSWSLRTLHEPLCLVIGHKIHFVLLLVLEILKVQRAGFWIEVLPEPRHWRVVVTFATWRVGILTLPFINSKHCFPVHFLQQCFERIFFLLLFRLLLFLLFLLFLLLFLLFLLFLALFATLSLSWEWGNCCDTWHNRSDNLGKGWLSGYKQIVASEIWVTAAVLSIHEEFERVVQNAANDDVSECESVANKVSLQA